MGEKSSKCEDVHSSDGNTSSARPEHLERFRERMKKVWSQKEKELGLGFLHDVRFITSDEMSVHDVTAEKQEAVESVSSDGKVLIIQDSVQSQFGFDSNTDADPRPVTNELQQTSISRSEDEPQETPIQSGADDVMRESKEASHENICDEENVPLHHVLEDEEDSDEKPPFLHSVHQSEEKHHNDDDDDDDDDDDIEVLHISIGGELDEEVLKEGSVHNINGWNYEIGQKLGKGGFGFVFAATRLHDDFKVAIKLVRKLKHVMEDYINIPGYPEPLPREVGLHMLANSGANVPVIIQFYDWEDHSKYYLMVLECPSPCEDVIKFMKRNRWFIKEDIAASIMWQATLAAEICCVRGVFHRDIKMENLLINPETLEVKLIDFGCGDLFKESAYREFMGTEIYFCPEYIKDRKYCARPMTVYSLGVVLFAIMCGKFPNDNDRKLINKGTWNNAGLSEECCNLIQACLQEDPKKRIDLQMIRHHKWFQGESPAEVHQAPIHSGSDDVVIVLKECFHDFCDKGNMQTQRMSLNQALDDEDSDDRPPFLFSAHQSEDEEDFEVLKTSLEEKSDEKPPFLFSAHQSEDEEDFEVLKTSQEETSDEEPPFLFSVH